MLQNLKKLLPILLIFSSASCAETQEREIKLVKNLEYKIEIVRSNPLRGYRNTIVMNNIYYAHVNEMLIAPDSIVGKLIFSNKDTETGTKDSVAVQLSIDEIDSLFIYTSKLFNEHKFSYLDTAVNGEIVKAYTTDFGMVSIKMYQSPIVKEVIFFNLESVDAYTKNNYHVLFKYIDRLKNE